MAHVAFQLPERLPITAVYEMKQHGRGWTAVRVFETHNQRVGANVVYEDGDGTHRVLNVPLATLKKAYAEHSQGSKSGTLCIMPYEYHLVAPAIPLLVVWRVALAEPNPHDMTVQALRAKFTERPRTLCGDYYPQYEWISEVPAETLAKWREF